MVQMSFFFHPAASKLTLLQWIFIKQIISASQHCFEGIDSLLVFRASLICGKLPAEEMRDLRAKLTKQMDVLNHMLELDLVVR